MTIKYVFSYIGINHPKSVCDKRYVYVYLQVLLDKLDICTYINSYMLGPFLVFIQFLRDEIDDKIEVSVVIRVCV